MNFALVTSTVQVLEGNSGVTEVTGEIQVTWPAWFSLARDVILLGTTNDITASEFKNFDIANF